ncbi:MAG: esterase-like activity of phytase family protein [Rhizomicrobium sp.]
MRAALILLCLLPVFPAFAGGEEPAIRPQLVGVGRIASDALDRQGETLGGFGSGMMLVPHSWHRVGKKFVAHLDLLPDRGWNTAGSVDYRARVQEFDIGLLPDDGAPGHEGQLTLALKKSLLLMDDKGMPTTGFDPVDVRPAAGAIPDLPVSADGHVSLDDEAIAPDGKGGFWVSDEYGPYVYRYNAQGRLIGALRPPEAFIPRRNGKENFSANSPPAGSTVDTGNPETGRQNNQGFEGMSVSPDGRTLFVVNQSALRQDLDAGNVAATRRNVRLLAYDITAAPRLIHEYALQLPLYEEDGKAKVAAQSELLAIDDHRFLLLCRDSGGGLASKRPASLYRKVELVDVQGATDIAGRYDGAADSIAPNGILRDDITPAAMADFVDLNDNAQLNRFGLHNGAPADAHDLYEKWESLALAPADRPGEYILLVGSDNDFVTQHGRMAGKAYADAGGADVDTLIMAWRVRIPQ